MNSKVMDVDVDMGKEGVDQGEGSVARDAVLGLALLGESNSGGRGAGVAGGGLTEREREGVREAFGVSLCHRQQHRLQQHSQQVHKEEAWA